MNTIGPYILTPISNAFNHFVEDPYEKKYNEFKSFY